MEKRIFFKKDELKFKMLLEVDAMGRAYFTDAIVFDDDKKIVLNTLPFEEIKDSLFKKSEVLDFLSERESLINKKAETGFSPDSLILEIEKNREIEKNMRELEENYKDNFFFR